MFLFVRKLDKLYPVYRIRNTQLAGAVRGRRELKRKVDEFNELKIVLTDCVTSLANVFPVMKGSIAGKCS